MSKTYEIGDTLMYSAPVCLEYDKPLLCVRREASAVFSYVDGVFKLCRKFDVPCDAPGFRNVLVRLQSDKLRAKRDINSKIGVSFIEFGNGFDDVKFTAGMTLDAEIRFATTAVPRYTCEDEIEFYPDVKTLIDLRLFPGERWDNVVKGFGYAEMNLEFLFEEHEDKTLSMVKVHVANIKFNKYLEA